MYIKYVFTQKDKDRSVHLHASITPTTPGLPDHHRAPVLQRQSPHRAVMHVTEATMCPVSRVNSSFSRVNSHKRRVKGAAGHSLQHTLLTLAFRVLSASVNMLLGALREQQQLRKGCFAGKLFKTRKKRSRVQSPAQPQHTGLHGPDCNSKYAAGSPARPAAAVGELFSKNVGGLVPAGPCALPGALRVKVLEKRRSL